MFFFNETAYTETYTYCHTLALHDALPICQRRYGEIVDPEGAPPCQPGREGHRGDGERQAERLDQIVLFETERLKIGHGRDDEDAAAPRDHAGRRTHDGDRKSTRLNSSH